MSVPESNGSNCSALTILKAPGDSRFPKPPEEEVSEFLETQPDGTPLDQFCETVGLRHDPLDLEESAESEAFAVAKIYAKRDQLRQGDRVLVTKLLAMLEPPKPRFPGLIKVGFKRGEPGHKKEQIVEAYVKQGGEEPDELKLNLPETEEETTRALEHDGLAWKGAHRQSKKGQTSVQPTDSAQETHEGRGINSARALKSYAHSVPPSPVAQVRSSSGLRIPLDLHIEPSRLR